MSKIYWCNCVFLLHQQEAIREINDEVVDGVRDVDALHAWLWFWSCFVPYFHTLILCTMREKCWWWFEALLVLEGHFRTQLVSHIIKCHFVCITVVTICLLCNENNVYFPFICFILYYETDRKKRMLAKKTSLIYIGYPAGWAVQIY